MALDRALRSATVWGELLAINLGALDYPDLVAEVADLMLPYEKAHWVLCVGQHNRTVFLSVRTDINDATAGALIRRVVGSQRRRRRPRHDRRRPHVRRGARRRRAQVGLRRAVARLVRELKISAAPTPLF